MSIMTLKNPKIALLGQPNSGKSTLFNGLTGARQRVGNWPGKTVEKKEGHYDKGGTRYYVTDLPGTYSLSANSEEEIITRDYIVSGQVDVVCILADSSQLSRSLFMLADYAGIQCPIVLLLNLMDVAESQGKTVDAQKLEEKLGIPVIPFVAADQKKYDTFFEAVDNALKNKKLLKADSLVEKYRNIGNGSYDMLVDLLPEEGVGSYSAFWLAAKLIEGDPAVLEAVKNYLSPESYKRVQEILFSIENGALKTAGYKFEWIDELLRGVLVQKEERKTLAKFDKLATHKRWGKPFAIFIILLGLIASFIPAAPIMMAGSLIPMLGGPIAETLTAIGAPQILIALINQVFLNTLYFAIAMIGFVFGVNLVFGFLEEVGYMARVSYVFDGTMSKLGLQGKSVMPIVVSFGCTIGGAAGTRVIDSWSQRVLTIALAWVVPCAATWAIVPVISSLFFGAKAPLVIVAIFVVAGLHMMVTAKIFGSKLIRQEDRSGLIMELPPYHKPRWRALMRSILVRTKDILSRALRIIFIVSLVFWFLTYSASGEPNTTLLYRFGRAIEPVTLVFGLTWQTFLAYSASMLSKEAALGVLGSLYLGAGTLFSATVGSGGSAVPGLGAVLLTSLTPASALAFIFAVTFNAPCLMAITSTYQETRSLKWTMRILVYYFATSLILAFLVYRIANLFF
ncbi:MAG: ferrous iron transport protein B [Eubacteriaceae bacterium]|jgi:ferrous iron transport protein B|nr:ferrous iron transport protein B [Eubacteriaceae bacterium]